MTNTGQPLSEFLQNIVSDITNNSLTSQETIVACQQYAYLRDALLARSEVLTQASYANEEEVKKILILILNESLSNIASLPSFQSQSPDAFTSEPEIKEKTRLREAAFYRTKKETTEKLNTYSSQKRAFIANLVKQYSSRFPNGASAAQLEETLNSALDKSSAAKSTSEATDVVSAAIGVPIDEAGVRYIQETHIYRKRAHEVYAVLFSMPEIQRPDVVADIVLSAPITESTEQTTVRAIKLAGTAAAIEQVSKKALNTANTFFSSDNAKGVSKGIQQAADGILSVVGEPFREIVYKNKVEGTFRALLQNTQQLTDRLGEQFVSSPLFKQINQTITKSLGEKPSSGGKSFFGDVFTSVFRGPLDPALVEGARDHMYQYMELMRANERAPEGLKFAPSGLLPWGVPWQARPIKPKTRRYIPLVGSIGAVANNFFSYGVNRTISTLFNNPTLGPRIAYSRSQAGIPTPLHQDLPLLIAITTVIVIILLFVFPSFLNPSYIDKTFKDNSILISLFQGESDSRGQCEGDCQWPLKDASNACIVTGPFVATHEKSHLDAIDFLGPLPGVSLFNAEVHTPFSGKATTVVFGFADNSGSQQPDNPHRLDGGTYGNHVVIETDKGGSLLFAHLRNINKANLKVGDTVKADTIIGFVDNTGYSEVSHLHYEARGASMDSFTPFPVPECIGRIGCAAAIIAQGNLPCI